MRPQDSPDVEDLPKQHSWKENASIMTKVFITRFISSGVLQQAVMSLIHVVQGCSVSMGVMPKIPENLQVLWTWATNVIGKIKDAFGFSDITHEQVLSASVVSVSIFLLSLVFSIQLGLNMTLLALRYLLICCPLAVAISFTVTNIATESWIFVGIIIPIDIGIIVGMWYCVRKRRNDPEEYEEFSEKNTFFKLLARIVDGWDIFLRRLDEFIYFGAEIAQRQKTMLLHVICSLVLSGSWVVFSMASFGYNTVAGIFIIVVIMIVLIVLVVLFLVVLKYTYNDVRRFLNGVYFFFVDAIYVPSIDLIVNCFIDYKSGQRPTSIIVYGIVWSIVLPIAFKIFITWSTWRIVKASKYFSHKKGMNQDKNYDRLMKYVSERENCFGFMDSYKRAFFWWPVVEIVGRCLYTVLSSCGVKYGGLIVMSIMTAFLLVIRPYKNMSSYWISLGEMVVLTFMNIIGDFLGEDAMVADGVMVVLILASVAPVCVAIIIFAWREVPDELDEELQKLDNAKTVQEDIRTILGLDGDTRQEFAKTIEDIPLYVRDGVLATDVMSVYLQQARMDCHNLIFSTWSALDGRSKYNKAKRALIGKEAKVAFLKTQYFSMNKDNLDEDLEDIAVTKDTWNLIKQIRDDQNVNWQSDSDIMKAVEMRIPNDHPTKNNMKCGILANLIVHDVSSWIRVIHVWQFPIAFLFFVGTLNASWNNLAELYFV